MALLMASTLSTYAQPNGQPPNIVLIVADDLGYGDLSCYGQTAWKTPRIDQLGAEGIRFTDFSVPTPYCAPSRATLLTGKYPYHHGLMDNPAPDATPHLDTVGLSLQETLLSQRLKARGYATACIGKWHLGHQPQYLPTRRGFDYYYGIPYSNDMRPVVVLEGEQRAEYPVMQATLTQRYTDKAIAFMEQNQDRPFFLYLPHAMPHKPLAPSAEYYTPKTKDDLYADVIRELDASVGRLLDKLDNLGLAENTLVIFMSDNGPWFGGSTGGLRGMKALTWEGGLRVPFIARYPGKIPTGQVSNAQLASIDLCPTLLNMASIPIPAGLDGKDVMPVLSAKAKSPHAAILGMFAHEVYTIKSGPWKLHLKARTDTPDYMTTDWVDPRGPDGVTITGPTEQPRPEAFPGLQSGDGPKAGMLFNLADDPGEQHDVAAQNPKVVKRLMKLYQQLTHPKYEKGPTK